MTNHAGAASYWISHLSLAHHPEGGYFKEVYRSTECVSREALPPRFVGGRCMSTSIYYLLEEGDFSAFHRIKSDEIWHFYAGGPLELHVIRGTEYSLVLLGPDPTKGHTLQYVVPYGSWFASRPATGSSYSLLGCTVSPGFDFEDFEMGRETDVFTSRPDLSPSLSVLCRSSD